MRGNLLGQVPSCSPAHVPAALILLEGFLSEGLVPPRKSVYHEPPASSYRGSDQFQTPPGEHKVKIELVDANHNVFPEQSKTVTFTIPGGASHSHSLKVAQALVAASELSRRVVRDSVCSA
jgi:hypothetical protein